MAQEVSPCFDCLHEYSFNSIGLISKLSWFDAGIIYSYNKSNFYLEVYWSLYLMVCIVCERELRSGFSYFCRGCYRETHKQLPITTTDFKRYLEISLGARMKLETDGISK